ncbi:hypothetical protein AB4Z50_09105 [Paenibacillus sp. 2TAB26]|uniref:hypothetical protein n=1 Tax=Paenibacillus sp. 2TAB26 TaxID=3233005 RepID=UPI003F97EB8E
MDFEGLFIKKITVENNFSYKSLYNDDRGAVYKDEYKSLIREAMTKGIITVEKFLIAEDVQDELYQISEDSKGLKYTLVELLKDYHSESNFVISPLIYLLKKLDPNFSLAIKEEKLEVVSDVISIEIRPRIDGMNATPRIYFPKEKVAIAVTNDNIENLGDILAVEGVSVYIIGTDDRSNVIYAFKVNRASKYFEVAKGYKQSVVTELFSKVRDIEI